MKEIVSLWIGPPPSYLEHVVIKSYLAAGHVMTIYSDRPSDEFPSEVQVLPPAHIAPDLILPPQDAGLKAAAVYSDKFRLMMLKRKNAIWVDMDAYCVRPFDFDGDNVFGQAGNNVIPNGIIGLEPNSPVPSLLLTEMMQPNPRPSWANPKIQKNIDAMERKNMEWGMEDLPWGISGPRALTYGLRMCGVIDQALPKDVFYSTLNSPCWAELFVRGGHRDELVSPNTKSVHFFSKCRKTLAAYTGHNPYKDGYIAEICAKHNVKPSELPIIMAEPLES